MAMVSDALKSIVDMGLPQWAGAIGGFVAIILALRFTQQASQSADARWSRELTDRKRVALEAMRQAEIALAGLVEVAQQEGAVGPLTSSVARTGELIRAAAAYAMEQRVAEPKYVEVIFQLRLYADGLSAQAAAADTMRMADPDLWAAIEALAGEDGGVEELRRSLAELRADLGVKPPH